MAWTPSEDITKIYSGPFLIGVGAAASEVSMGEVAEVEVTTGYHLLDIYAGCFYGRQTKIDSIVDGIEAGATFMLLQTDTTTLDTAFALATLSAGATNKSMTLDVDTICGASLAASATRIRFHKYSVASLTDETKDIIFPKAIIVPAPEPFSVDGSGATMIPCVLLAFPDSNKDIVIFGQNVT